jgi:hypothetical protein
MARLPTVSGDNNTWGTVLNEYLSVSLDTDGTIKSTALTSKIGTVVGSPTTVTGLWVGPQATYDGLTPDDNTLYFIQ